MKKALLITMLAVLAFMLVMATGCGGAGGGEAGQEETVAGGSENGGDGGVEGGADASLAGTYRSADGKVIILAADGTFTTDAWEGAAKGTYLFSDDELGKWVDLAFEDGSSISMSAILADDQVAAILDQDSGIQYTRE